MFSLLVCDFLFNDAAFGVFHFLQIGSDAFFLIVLRLVMDKTALIKGGVNISWTGSYYGMVLSVHAAMRRDRICARKSVLNIFILVLLKSLPDILNLSIMLLFLSFNQLFFHECYFLD